MLDGYLFREMTRFVTIFLAVCLMSTVVVAKNAPLKGKITELPSGASVRVLSVGRTIIGKRGTYLTAKIQLVTTGNPTHSNERIADEFFSLLGINLLRIKVKKAAVIFITSRIKNPLSNAIVKFYAEKSEWYFYEKKEKGLWLPEKRELPDWLKAKTPKKITLSNGQSIFLEQISTLQKSLLGKPVPMIDLITTNYNTSTGSKPMLDVTRRYANEKLTELLKNNEYIIITIYFDSAKDGINIRRRRRLFVLRKNKHEFWLASTIAKSYFTGTKSFSLMLYYQPKDDFNGVHNLNKLNKEAEEIQHLFGSRFAEHMKLNSTIILALWAAEKVGTKVQRYGVGFTKDKNGIWQKNKKR